MCVQQYNLKQNFTFLGNSMNISLFSFECFQRLYFPKIYKQIRLSPTHIFFIKTMSIWLTSNFEVTVK